MAKTDRGRQAQAEIASRGLNGGAAGERACVVLVPGLLCDAQIWTGQIAALKARAEVIAFEAMRFSTIGAMAEEVLKIAPKRFSIAGHSMGGRVALEIARRAPERLERIALISTGFSPARPGEEIGRYALVDIADRQGMTAVARVWLPPMLSARGLKDKRLVKRLTEMVERADPELFRCQVKALLSRPDAEPDLGAIRCPAQVVVGRDDGWSPVEQHRALAARIPGAALEIVEDCGHMSLVEQPEAITAALMRWLDRDASSDKLGAVAGQYGHPPAGAAAPLNR